MALVLFAIGALMFVKGCVDQDLLRTQLRRTSGELVFPSSFSAGETFVEILFFNVFLNVVGWFFVFNIGRFVHYFVTRSDTIRTFKATRNEKAELEALQRRLAIKELREKLGSDDDDAGEADN